MKRRSIDRRKNKARSVVVPSPATSFDYQNPDEDLSGICSEKCTFHGIGVLSNKI